MRKSNRNRITDAIVDFAALTFAGGFVGVLCNDNKLTLYTDMATGAVIGFAIIPVFILLSLFKG